MDWTGLIEVELVEAEQQKHCEYSTFSGVPGPKKCPAVQSATPASLVTTSNELSLELRFSISKSVSLTQAEAPGRWFCQQRGALSCHVMSLSRRKYFYKRRHGG
jgi:hypothetical protein